MFPTAEFYAEFSGIEMAVLISMRKKKEDLLGSVGWPFILDMKTL